MKKKLLALVLAVCMIFSLLPVTALAAGDKVAKIGDKEFATLAEAIVSIEDNTATTITMLADVEGANGISIPSGRNITVDFDGHTYSVEKPGAGSSGTKTQAFQLLKDSNITFKNGTISCTAANKDFTWDSGDSIKGVAMVIQNYANLTLDNMTIDGTNIAHNGTPGTVRYVVSNNSGTVNINNSTITAASGDFAFDSCKSGSYPIPTVNVTDSTITGNVEVTGGMLNLASGTVNGFVKAWSGTANLNGGTVNGLVGCYDEGTVNVAGATITAENGVVVWGDGKAGESGCKTPTLNVSSGTINGTNAAIITNGTDESDAVINITGGTIQNESNVAIYAPSGIWTISGGTITGKTAMYFKSEKLEITGGTFTGSGAKANYQYDGNGCNATGDALVIDSCNYPNGLKSEDISISGGNFKSTNGVAVAAFTSQGATPVTAFISGGLFSSDVTALCASGKTALANTDDATKADYPYMIGDKNTEILIDTTAAAGETPTVPAPSIPGADVNVQAAAVKAVDAINTTIATVSGAADLIPDAKTIANNDEIITETEDSAKAKLEAESITVGDTVTLVVEPYLDVKVIGAEVDAETPATIISVIYDIEAKYDLIATTAEKPEDIVLTEGDTQNAVVVKSAQPMKVTQPVTISIPLPSGFNSTGEVVVKHTKDNGDVHYYNGNVDPYTKVLTFTNPNGFSTFAVLPIAAGINGTFYPTLAEAVAAVKNGETIKLATTNTEEVTVSRTVSFTLNRNGQTFSGSIEAGANTVNNGTGDTYNFVYTAPVSSYRITVESTENGSVKSNRTASASGSKVTLTVAADEGYELDTLSVTDKKGAEVALTDNGDGTYSFRMPASAVTVSASFKALPAAIECDGSEACPAHDYADVDCGDWYHEAIDYVITKEYMIGYETGEFGPDDTMDWAMAVRLLYNMAGQPNGLEGENWYAAAVEWALAGGYLEAMDDYEVEIARGDLFKLFWNCAGAAELDADLSVFSDAGEIADEHLTAAKWAVSVGMVKGNADGTIKSNSTATRTEMAQLMYNWYLGGN